MGKSNRDISVFFSYGHDCEELVFKIKSDLEKKGFKIWIDDSEIKIGNEWRQKITQGILESDVVMAFLSSYALRKNGVCLNELAIAVGCKNGFIKTVLLEPDIDSLIPSTIAGIQYCNMSKWRQLMKEEPLEFSKWYDGKLEEILEILSSKDAAEMNSQLKYLEQMLSPTSWHLRQHNELQKNYISRQTLENTLENWLYKNDSARTFMVYGGPGSGKSSCVINYHHYNYEAVAIAFCDWKKKGNDRINNIIRSIAFQLAIKIPTYRVRLAWLLEKKNTSFKLMDERELFDLLFVDAMQGNIHFEDERYVIVIDAIDELNEKGENLLADIISSQSDNLPKAIKFLISSRNDGIINTYFSDSEEYEINPDSKETKESVKEYYRIQLSEVLSAFDENEQNKIFDELVEKSEGNFLYTELCSRAICEGKMLIDDIKSIPNGLHGIYHQWFNRLFPSKQDYYEQYYDPLAILCAIEDPIPSNLLQKIMNWRQVELRKFFRTLKVFLKRQDNAFGKETVTLFHNSMKSWLTSEISGCFEVCVEDGLNILKKQMEEFFDNKDISPYQCKLFVSILEKTKDNKLRKKIYASDFFLNQYLILAKRYEEIRSGYYKAVTIYEQIMQMCKEAPSSERDLLLESTLPCNIGRCYCEMGDYFGARRVLDDSLMQIETYASSLEIMEVYYILGSVYDWFGEREKSIGLFNKLYDLAIKESYTSYIIKALIGIIWNDHFNNISEALKGMDKVINNSGIEEIDKQMCELIRARVLLSNGQLGEALKIYDKCLLDFDFSFVSDIRGYRKNRLMLIEILPACYDNAEYKKGVEVGKQILEQIYNTGWLEECYCSSWIALNYLGLGDIENSVRFLKKAKYLANVVDGIGKSEWMEMHLSSIEAHICFECEEYVEALEKHIVVTNMASLCNDGWVLGDACFEIVKLCILYLDIDIEMARTYAEILEKTAQTSHLSHLEYKNYLAKAVIKAYEGKFDSAQKYIFLFERFTEGKSLPSTNYLDVACIKSVVYKLLGMKDKHKESVLNLYKMASDISNCNRLSSKTIIKKLGI